MTDWLLLHDDMRLDNSSLILELRQENLHQTWNTIVKRRRIKNIQGFAEIAFVIHVPLLLQEQQQLLTICMKVLIPNVKTC
jgi:hypothetical protein